MYIQTHKKPETTFFNKHLSNFSFEKVCINGWVTKLAKNPKRYHNLTKIQKNDPRSSTLLAHYSSKNLKLNMNLLSKYVTSGINTKITWYISKVLTKR